MWILPITIILSKIADLVHNEVFHVFSRHEKNDYCILHYVDLTFMTRKRIIILLTQVPSSFENS